ncbi:hypothetical protein LIA77_08461 [Sarocladium implicatum]|nr:hypothetical protein LIA77_08461 [Sarocladium implicatum]
MEPPPRPATSDVGRLGYVRVEDVPDRGGNRTPIHGRHQRKPEPYNEIWVIIRPMDASHRPRFLIALRHPASRFATIYQIAQDSDFESGLILRFDRNSELFGSSLSSWRGLGVLQKRHVRNFYRTLLDVPLMSNNEWILTFLYRLEQGNFIRRGQTEDWLRAYEQYDDYQAFWRRLGEQRQVRFLPDGPQIPLFKGDPMAYWSYDANEGSLLYYDSRKPDWADWSENEESEAGSLF